MNLITQLLLGQLANRHQENLSEGIVDVFFVVLDRRLRVLQVLDVEQHVQRVSQRHQEVVHLVKSLPVAPDTLQKVRHKHSVPVEEPATSGLSHNDLPAADHFELVVPVFDLFELCPVEHIGIYEV